MIKQVLAFTLCAFAGLFVLNNNAMAVPQSDMNGSFDSYKDNFVTALWKTYPGFASSVGYHKYDNVLTVPDATERDGEIKFCNEQLNILKQFNLPDLSDNNKTDYHLIENFL